MVIIIKRKKKRKLIGIARGAVGASLGIGIGASTLQKMGYSQVGMSSLAGYVGPVTSITMGKHMMDQLGPLIKKKRVVVVIKKKRGKK